MKSADDGVDISVQLRHVCLEYPYKSLQAATNNFDSSRQLGEGSAGTVFKAEMQDGSFAAVKVIDLAKVGENAMVAGFEEEVMILSKFRHPNVVVLMGWARQDTRRFLIYEMLTGGDVFGRLQKSKDGLHPFLWHERLSVCRDSAMGLAHLHNATPHAFHRDVKSSNILLGPSGAKIADFGLSLVSKTRTESENGKIDCEFPSGTPGYTCPIYIQSGKMTEGSEVYSFGMVLLEVLLNMMPAGLMGDEFVYPIRDLISPGAPGAVDRAVSSADPTAGWPAPVVREVAALGLACVDADESRRPNFNEVCRLLRFLQEQFPPTCIIEQPQQFFPPPQLGPPLPTGAWNMVLRPPMGVGMPLLPAPVPQGIQLVGPAPAPPPPVGGIPLGTVPPGMLMAPGAVRPGFSVAPGRPPGNAMPGFPMMSTPPGVCLPQPGPPAVQQVVLVQQVQQVSGVPPPGAPGAPLLAAGPGRPVGIMQQNAAAAPPPMPQAAAAPVVEVALEVAYVHGAELAHMKPEFRMLPLLPAVDAEGRCFAVLGRQHQPQWFELVLPDRTDLGCISREAFELSWGGPDPGQAALSLRVLGSNIILVDDNVAPAGQQVLLQPGSRITFAFQSGDANPSLFVILTFRVHCAPQLAAPRGLAPPVAAPPGGAGAVLPGRPSNPENPLGGGYAAPVVAPALPLEQEDAWKFECIFATGLGPEAFWSLSGSARNLFLPLGAGAAPSVLGRSHQKEMFEALLSHEPSFLGCISRSHVQVEEVKAEANPQVCIESLPNEPETGLLVTNLSSNVVVASRVNLQPVTKALYQNDSAELRDGDTLSFATEQHTVCAEEAAAAMARKDKGEGDSGQTSVAVVPFLTFRVVAPPAPPPPSPFVMVSPPSLMAVPPSDSEREPEAADDASSPVAQEGLIEQAPRSMMPLTAAVTTPEADKSLRRSAPAGMTGAAPSPAAATVPAVGQPRPNRKSSGGTGPDKSDCVCQ